jgi:acyl-CoA reductase-like NAD-dependent aldehyde dehydrogenase
MLMRIGGTDTAAEDDRWIPVVNPATGEQVDRVPEGSADDLDHAVHAAEDAFSGWKKKTLRERGVILFHAAGRVREQHKELA